MNLLKYNTKQQSSRESNEKIEYSYVFNKPTEALVDCQTNGEFMNLHIAE